MTVHGTSRFIRPLLLGVILAAAPFLYADEAMDRLVRLVGRDAGLCVEVPRLDETLTAFEQGEFFQRLERSKIYAKWKSGSEYHRVANIARVVEKLTGKPARQFVREIFGTAVVVAAYTEPGPKMSAVLMSEAMSRETLDAAIQAWNRVEPPRIEAVEFSGHTYYRRLCAAKPGRAALTLYYATLDRTLVLSDREELVRRALTLSDPAASHASLFDLPAYQQARQSLTPSCAARAYINPRAFDAMLDIGAAKIESGRIESARPAPQASGLKTGTSSDVAKPTNSAVCQTIQAAWRSCEWLAIGVETDRGIVLEGVAHYSAAGLSEGAQGLIRSMSGAPEILRLVPGDAFVVLACRQPFGSLLRQALTGHAKQPAVGAPAEWETFRQVSRGLLLGLDLVDDVLPSFRENFGGYLAPRQGAKPEELPFEGLLAAELPSTESSGAPRGPASTSSRPRPSARDAIDNALNTGFNFAAAYFNMSSTGTPAVVRTESEQARGTRVRWIDGLGPYRPAYGLTSRYLVLATSPQAVRNLAVREATDTAQPAGQVAGGSTRRVPASIETIAKRYFPTENQLLFIDTAAIRRFLHAHGPQLIQHAIRVRSITSEHAEKTLAKFLDVAGLFDTVFAAARLGDGSARVVIGGIVNGPATSEAASAR
ncbi:MAG TPA: hypothetical protein VMR25_14460 [Planctomycetaceae bacterium]|jgi:hypothetical protein|nr:hypothetical protein [Planctomycetaceae bacterium]